MDQLRNQDLRHRAIAPESIKSIAEGGAPDDLFIGLEEAGVPASRQVELARRSLKELEDSIRTITWTKERLLYTSAILEHTLSRENNSVTSAENLIKNYLIFFRIFKEAESKLPRFGQFEYVMRSVFRGITTKDEIYERIAAHKTFGEGGSLDQAEVAALSQKIGAASEEIQREYLAAQERKRELDSMMREARDEEERHKSTTWSVGYSEPREYTFPHYTFQTGPNAGKNTAPGRSSWEPMFAAYVDVVNKKMADRISSKSELSDEEKADRIAEHRVELLYEPFQFPVDVKSDNGKERPVVYIPDFIDINRWHVVEIKGPLTPKAAEKIRLFQKYYVDGDFSYLPGEKQILMMRYVEDKKAEIARWCEERNYPVQDHFSALSVLGAYKWDYELNNFNQYKNLDDMTGLSRRQKEQLQKGFIKLVEDRIELGKTPDIRPEQYANSDQLPTLIKMLSKEARSQRVPFEIEPPFATRPYDKEALANELLNATSTIDDISLRMIHMNRLQYLRVLETLPIPGQQRKALGATLVLENNIRELEKDWSAFLMNLTPDQYAQINSGKQLFAARHDVTTVELYRNSLEQLSSLLDSIRKLQFDKDPVVSDKAQMNEITAVLKRAKNIYEKRVTFEKNGASTTITKETTARSAFIDPLQFLSTLVPFETRLLGPYIALYNKRVQEVDTLTSNKMFESNREINTETVRKGLEGDVAKKIPVGAEYLQRICVLSLMEENATDVMGFSTLFMIVTGGKLMTPGHAHAFFNVIQSRFSNLKAAARHFASHTERDISEREYMLVLDRLNNDFSRLAASGATTKELSSFLSENLETTMAISEIMLTDELGDARYRRIFARCKANYEKYAKR